MNDQLYWITPDGTAHERCQLLFTSTGELVGFDPGAHPELGYRRQGLAYFCATCGEIWERVALIGSDGKMRGFEVVATACSKHADRWNIPGSILEGYRTAGLLPLLPAAVAKREFTITLAWWERENLGQSAGVQAA